jgi:hypothetical protein
VNLYPSAAYTLVINWAVGVALTVAVADTEAGLIRDHPLVGRRLSARVVPSMGMAGLAAPFLLNVPIRSLPPIWILLSVPLMLPFAWLSWRWSRNWIGHQPAAKRRRNGLWAITAGMIGLIASWAVAVHALTPAWKGVIPLAVFAAGVALPGSLTTFSIMSLTAGLPAEVPGGKTQGVAEVAGAGFLINCLVLPNVAGGWLDSGASWPGTARLLVLGWVACSLAIPGSILILRLWWRRMPDAWFMPVAAVSALAGQMMANLLIFGFPGLVPPVQWG